MNFYFSLTLLPSASNEYLDVCLTTSCGHISFGLPYIYKYHFGISSAQRLRGLPNGMFSFWFKRFALGTVGAIPLTCDHHLFMCAICPAGCMLTRRLISSFLFHGSVFNSLMTAPFPFDFSCYYILECFLSSFIA